MDIMIPARMLTKVIRAILVTIPNRIRAKVPEDKLLHGILAAYIVSLLEISPIWAFAGFVIAATASCLRERLSDQPDSSDARWALIFGAAELLRYLLFHFIL